MIGVVITTYNRKDILRETLQRAKEFLKSSEPLRYYICDDGSEDGTFEMLAYQSIDFRLIKNNRVGLGANANSGLRLAFNETDVVLQFQDDLWLEGSLDLDPHAKVLRELQWVRWVRLGQYVGHGFQAQMAGDYWVIDWNSPEIYIASDKPHIKHRDFHQYFGYYPEGLRVADTENSWCGNVKQQAMGVHNAPLVAIAATVPNGIFSHVGPSWQTEGL